MISARRAQLTVNVRVWVGSVCVEKGDTVGINIPITNPTNKVLKMNVLLDHPSLFGEKSFVVKPKQTFSYHVQFSAAALGAFAGSVMFRSDVVGEFWYELKFNVEKPSPTGLPDIRCELGKWAHTNIPLANPTHETLVLQMVNSDPSHFTVETDPNQPVTLPYEYTYGMTGKTRNAMVPAWAQL
ncbi:hypothetical protein DUI87_15715 [Hirundo rustica rustica]|uniref:Uncharacterized protein n=1 Tax=Hirundo rustica rustica TaxID=333673 RepID=A0A3M0K4S3_HIRRU|nr:hypothetical protein DUI87_15715 [Hirundo rustica rustica]